MNTPLVPSTRRDQTRRKSRLLDLVRSGLLLLLLPTGCATRELWTKHVFSAACPAELRLFECAQPADVLVSYREQNVTSGRVQPRAFLLFANATNVANYHKPDFVQISNFAGKSQIPVLDPAAFASNAPPASGWFATTMSTNRLEFALHRDGQFMGKHRLPGYESMSGSWRRAALTPLTMGLDVVTGCVLGGAAMGYSGK